MASVWGKRTVGATLFLALVAPVLLGVNPQPARAGTCATAANTELTLNVSPASDEVQPGKQVTVQSAVTNCTATVQTIRVDYSFSGDFGANNAYCLRGLNPTSATLTVKPGATQSHKFSVPQPPCLGGYTVNATAVAADAQALAEAQAWFSVTFRPRR